MAKLTYTSLNEAYRDSQSPEELASFHALLDRAHAYLTAAWGNGIEGNDDFHHRLCVQVDGGAGSSIRTNEAAEAEFWERTPGVFTVFSVCTDKKGEVNGAFIAEYYADGTLLGTYFYAQTPEILANLQEQNLAFLSTPENLVRGNGVYKINEDGTMRIWSEIMAEIGIKALVVEVPESGELASLPAKR